ncbi:MAG: sigma-70 family RNA polymerase sigma factor [Candidatus Hydrogenedentota bacterium]
MSIGSVSDAEEHFGRLYRENRDRLRGAAFRLTGSDDRADELVSEAFTRAWEHFGRFRGEASFSTWIHRILLNLVYSIGRAREFTLHEDLPIADEHRHGPHAQAEASEIRTRIDLALAELSPMQREVFLLREFEDMKHAEIAAKLGMAESTSKVHYFHAVKRLKEKLHDLA